MTHFPPSAATQRNAGVLKCANSSTLIGFADDDTTFEPHAFKNMIKFWNTAAPNILGAAFNLRNYPNRGAANLKHGTLAQLLGLYSSQPGSVCLSGWQTVIGEVAETQFVDWLPSTAVVIRRDVFCQSLFDNTFEEYSYLEDLDLSYTISRSGLLAVVANAGFLHFPSPSGRVSSRKFGRYEVRNRLHFVRKHRLSLIRCYLGLSIRFAMTVFSGVSQLNTGLLSRAVGNVEELLDLCLARALCLREDA
jgi:GT2 family glycosyltransferase